MATVKRFLGSMGRRASGEKDGAVPNGDSPEASVARGVRLFCESGGPNNQGEEVLHLPVIVEAAESSPAAAREAANGIRRFLSKDNFQRAYVQYNAIMLVRILSDNPGKTFTKNLDSKFIMTTKDLLRDGRDMSVQQILRETLDNFQTAKKDDENLAPMRDMWAKYKQKMEKKGGPARAQGGAIQPGIAHTQSYPYAQNITSQASNNQQNYFARTHSYRGLPPPHELAGRIEEAKTSAKLLQQVVQSTPPSEFVNNDLIKEFVDRCQSASRSIQGYIHSNSPAPDEDTLLTLIETNDQLSVALSRHQRAMLQARKATVPSPASSAPVAPPPAQMNGASEPLPNPSPAPGLFSRRKQSAPQPQQPAQDPAQENPFSDHHETQAEPNDYGLPPSTMARNNTPQGSSAGQERSSKLDKRYDDIERQNGKRDEEDDSPVSPEDTRRPPVQYRF